MSQREYKRHARVSVLLLADIKRELQSYAESYGLTVSALGGYIIGQWISEEREKRARPPVAAAENQCPGVPE